MEGAFCCSRAVRWCVEGWGRGSGGARGQSHPPTLVLGPRVGDTAGVLTEEEPLGWSCWKSQSMPNREEQGGLLGVSDSTCRHRLFTLHAIFWEPQVGGFGWSRTNRTYYLYLKNLLRMTDFPFSCRFWRSFQPAALLFSECRPWWSPVLARSR